MLKPQTNTSIKKIAFITDAHLGQKVVMTTNEMETQTIAYLDEIDEHKENFRTVLNDIVKKGISEVVFGGDIGSPESNKWFFDIINQYGFNLQIILGNHDSYSETSKYYLPRLITSENELKYLQEDNFFRYIFMDTSSNSISAGQFKWLKDNLKTEKKIVIFSHHPIIQISTPIDHLGAALKGREEIKQVLLNLKNEVIIFCGHYHMEDQSTEKNILQISTIACSYQIEKAVETVSLNDQTFGYRILTIENDNIDTELISFVN